MLAKLDAASTPQESKALRLLAWALTLSPRSTTWATTRVLSTISRAQAIPMRLPAGQCALALSVEASLSCPKVALVLRCPGACAVAISLTGAHSTAKGYVWRHHEGSGRYVDTEVDAEVASLLVRSASCCCCWVWAGGVCRLLHLHSSMRQVHQCACLLYTPY